MRKKQRNGKELYAQQIQMVVERKQRRTALVVGKQRIACLTALQGSTSGLIVYYGRMFKEIRKCLKTAK